MLIPNEMLTARVLVANKVGDMGDGNRLSDGSKYVEPKTGRSKGWKLAKSQKLSMLKGKKSKKPLKSENSHNFNTTEVGPSFLTPEARAALNRLWLAFTKAPVLWHFD